MVVHLSKRQIDLYHRRSLPPPELLAVDDHIDECESCRLELARGHRLDEALAAWQRILDGGATGAPASSRSRGWREVLLARPAAAFFAAAACAALIVGVAALAFHRDVARLHAEASRSRQVGARRDSELTRLRRENAGLRQSLPRAGAGAEIALADSGRRVEVDARGRLHGLREVPADWERAVATALVTGSLEHPAGLTTVAEREAALRGRAAAFSFDLLAPVATAVRDGRPRFRWSALPGARSYRITVVDANYRQVAASGPLTSIEWTPPQPLPRGVAYSWQVMARRDDRDIQAPAPPIPEARFRVLSVAEDADLARAEGLRMPSHLLLAVLDARAGLLEDAARELAALARENPGSPILSRLTASLAAG